jgi:IS30 family transposase
MNARGAKHVDLASACCYAIVDCAKLVIQKLSIDWSPQQISGWLKIAYPDDESMRVSHETIYRTLFIQARGILNPRLSNHLRRRQCMRVPRAARHPRARSRIPDAMCITARPVEVEQRSTPGHWEGDLLCGDVTSQIATLVERKSRYLMLIKVPSKSTDDVVGAVSEHVLTLPIDLRRSLTWDRGIEMTNHKARTARRNFFTIIDVLPLLSTLSPMLLSS